jgi:hypothetical protein
MRKATLYYNPRKHEGSYNNTGAAYRYELVADSVGTFANYSNGERVAGLTGRDLDGNWKRFRFEGIIRLSGI